MSEVEAVAPQLDLAGDAGIQRLPLSSSVEDSPLGEAEFPLTIFSMWCVYHMAWYVRIFFLFRSSPPTDCAAIARSSCDGIMRDPQTPFFFSPSHRQVLVLPLRLPPLPAVQEEAARSQHPL